MLFILAWFVGTKNMFFQRADTPDEIVIEQRNFIEDVLFNGGVISLKDKEYNSQNYLDICEKESIALIAEIQSINVDDVIGLEISRSDIQEDHLHIFSLLKNLEELTFIDCGMDDQKAKILSHFDKLRNLTFSCEEGITGECFATLAEMKSLYYIGLVNNPNIKCKYWNDLFISQIPSIGIIECPLTDDVLLSIPNNKSLTGIALNNVNGITDEVVHFFNCCPNLIGLDLRDNSQITGKILDQFRYPQKIEYMVLDGLDITDDHLKNISQFTNLETLCLNNTKISGESAVRIFAMSSLIYCDVDNTNLHENAKYLLRQRFHSGDELDEFIKNKKRALFSQGGNSSTTETPSKKIK